MGRGNTWGEQQPTSRNDNGNTIPEWMMMKIMMTMMKKKMIMIHVDI
jgi:hypothetical protein